MNVCRVCLSNNPDKDIYEIQTDKHLVSNNETFAYIMLFCLDLQITKDSQITTKLCSKCYRKIILYYKFKSLALQSDAFLKSLDNKGKNEVYLSDDNQTKMEVKSECTLSDQEPSLVNDDEIKSELGANDLVEAQDYHSDDELLSVIKNMKHENVTEETKENEHETPDYIQNPNQILPDAHKTTTNMGKPGQMASLCKRKRGRPKKGESRMQVCEECGKLVKNLKEHLYRHQPVSSRKKYQCDKCDKVFNCARTKNQHIRRKHVAIKQHCKECNKYVANLKRHEQVIHNPETLPFKCMVCVRRFISKSVLNQHMTLHTKDRPYLCVDCGKRFRSKTTMKVHKRAVHENEKSHLCQFCSKRFFKKYHLVIHIRSHTKEKPYKCPDCGKSFSSTSILKNHRTIHSEEKTFSCTLCEMTFVRYGYLRAHMVTHTKEKRFPCQFCGVKFHRSDHRRRHEQAHQRHLATITTS